MFQKFYILKTSNYFSEELLISSFSIIQNRRKEKMNRKIIRVAMAIATTPVTVDYFETDFGGDGRLTAVPRSPAGWRCRNNGELEADLIESARVRRKSGTLIPERQFLSSSKTPFSLGKVVFLKTPLNFCTCGRFKAPLLSLIGQNRFYIRELSTKTAVTWQPNLRMRLVKPSSITQQV